MLIVVLFVLLLPTMVSRVGFQYTNYYLLEQKKKVLAVIDKNGLDYYLQGDTSYGSYTMLKEEYISLFPAGSQFTPDTTETSRRVVEGDTLNYRVLTHELTDHHKKYVLEIGKTISTIGEYNSLLQRFTLYALIGLTAITILVDLVYSRILLKPLDKIVQTKILDRKFPFKESLSPVKTSTSDFKFLDRSLISLMEKIHEAFDKEREFTSNASHELMTPVSILQTTIENMMVESEITESQAEKLSSMMKTLNRLKKIVRSLLYISRIENEQFTKMDVVPMRSLIVEIMEELDPKLELKSLHFNNQISSEVKLNGVNHDLLFQLFYNLISNAIRYNKEHGAITISENHAYGQPYRISVNDTGIGIRREELGTIFNRFKKSGQKDCEGYGLGLSIVKSIVVYHNCIINVFSEYGKGTEFIVIFPSSF